MALSHPCLKITQRVTNRFNMSVTIAKKKSLNELPLFRSISMFITSTTPYIINMNKDIKVTFGYNILNNLMNCLTKLRHSYSSKNQNVKLDYILQLIDDVEEISDLFKLLFELKYISIKQQANISIQVGDMLMQLNGWK